MTYRARMTALLLALAATIGVVAALVASAQPSAAEEPTESVTVYDQPVSVLPDLPKGWGSFCAHQRNGRTWLVVTNPQGGVAMVPWVDADGEQVVVGEAN